jgi:hypothetical protein
MRKVLGVFLGLWLLVGSVPLARATDPIAQAVAWLHTQQCNDGSFGSRGTNGSCTPSTSVTADVVYVLALIGEDPAGAAWTMGGKSALDALAGLTPSYIGTDAGRAGRVARAVALTGGNPRDFGGLNLVAKIDAAYDPTTGHYYPYNLLYNHTLAVEGLLRAGEPVPSPAINALVQAQLPDGSWFWSFDGTQGDVDSTGRVMQVLGNQAHIGCFSGYARAADYLAAALTATGGWGVYPPPNTNPPNANSTALAIAGLNATGFDPQAARFQKNGQGALDTLLTFQEASGAFAYIQQTGKQESRLMATVDALNALAQPTVTQPICRSLYLPLVIR